MRGWPVWDQSWLYLLLVRFRVLMLAVIAWWMAVFGLVEGFFEVPVVIVLDQPPPDEEREAGEDNPLKGVEEVEPVDLLGGRLRANPERKDVSLAPRRH
jgi:hypothetical protein